VLFEAVAFVIVSLTVGLLLTTVLSGGLWPLLSSWRG
jgi:hypothetical protein